MAAVCFSSQLYAQQDSAKKLEEIVVTATKQPIKQSQTGKVITVITKEQIEKSTGKTVGQLLNEQVGLTINGALNNIGSPQSVFLRGATTGRTLVLLDGVPAYDPSLINNEFDLNLLSLNNIESIEICRGAQSTLYGSDAVAGVINIITTKSDVKKPFNAKASASAGSFGVFRGNAQVFGKIDKLTYSARYAKLTTRGFSAAFDSTGNNNFDKDKYNGDVINAALQYQVAPSLLFKTFVQQSNYKSAVDDGGFNDEKDFVIDNKNLMAGAGFRFNKGDISLTGNYQYSDITRDYTNDSTDKPGFVLFSTDKYYGKNQFVEMFANIKLSNNFSLLQGADYRFSNMNGQYSSLTIFDPVNPYVSNIKDTVQSQGSIYASLFYAAFEQKLNLELGGRLNVHSRYGSNHTFTFNPSYSINNNFRVFGSIATGFKAPSLYQLYSSSGKLDLKPELSTTYELGMQQTHSKFKNRVVYFNREIKDGIDFNYISFNYFNFVKQMVKGIELESTAEPVKNFILSFNYTYLHSKETSQSRITFDDTTYTYLLRRPKHNLNINAGYQFKNGLYTSVSAKYVSGRFDVGGYQKNDVQLDSYFLLNAYASFTFKKYIKIFADAQNVTNKQFFDLRGFNAIPFLLNGGIIFNW
ncbi:MAG: TonB-dependent receptor [Chitinophagaceae bacterium]|nr:TonB-dependent receptor [Chitinophagaceae bacterium]